MQVEIVHARDSDGPCAVSVFVDGVAVPSDELSVVTVDLGSRWSADEWVDALDQVASDPSLSAAARDAAVAQLVAAVESLDVD